MRWTGGHVQPTFLKDIFSSSSKFDDERRVGSLSICNNALRRQIVIIHLKRAFSTL